MNKPNRYVAVELTEDECDAIHVLCDMAGGMLAELGHTITASQRESLKLRLNAVRFKMGASIALFQNKDPNGASGIAPGLILDIHGRNRKPS